MQFKGQRPGRSQSGSGAEVRQAAQSRIEQIVLFRVGEILCCVDISAVSGLIRVPALTKVPCAPPAVLGVFNHRSQVLTAISLRCCFGLPEAEAGVGYVLLAQLQDGLTGFWVDDVMGIISPPDDWWRPLPAIVSVAFCDRVLVREDGVFLLINLSQLLELLHIHKSPEVIARMARQIRASEAVSSGVDQSVGRATPAGRPVFAAATGEELEPVEALGGLGEERAADFGVVVGAETEPLPAAPPTEAEEPAHEPEQAVEAASSQQTAVSSADENSIPPASVSEEGVATEPEPQAGSSPVEAEQPADEEEKAVDEAVAQEVAAQDAGDTSTPMAETAESEEEIARKAELVKASAPVETAEQGTGSVPSTPTAEQVDEFTREPEPVAAPVPIDEREQAHELVPSGPIADSEEEAAAGGEALAAPALAEPDQPAAEAEQAVEEAVSLEDVAHDAEDPSVPPAPAESEQEAAGATEPVETSAPVDAGEQARESVSATETTDLEEEVESAPEPVEAATSGEVEQHAGVEEQALEEPVVQGVAAPDVDDSSVPTVPAADSEEAVAGEPEPVEAATPVEADQRADEEEPEAGEDAPWPAAAPDAQVSSVPQTAPADSEQGVDSEPEFGEARVPIEVDEDEQVSESVPPVSALESLLKRKPVSPAPLEAHRKVDDAVAPNFSAAENWAREKGTLSRRSHVPDQTVPPTSSKGRAVLFGGTLLLALLLLAFALWFRTPARTPTDRASGTKPAPPASVDTSLAQVPPPPPVLKETGAAQPLPPASVDRSLTQAPPPPPVSKETGAAQPLPPASVDRSLTQVPPPPPVLEGRGPAQSPPPASVDRSLTQAPPPPPVSEGSRTAQPPSFPVSEIEGQVMVHVVVWGDTLSKISRRYLGDMMRYPELARDNKIKNPDLIYPGDIVRIQLDRQPPANPD